MVHFIRTMVLTRITERRIRAGRETTPDGEAAVLPPIHIMAELFATTPPHIRDTNNTLAKGVHLETLGQLKRYAAQIQGQVVQSKGRVL